MRRLMPIAGASLCLTMLAGAEQPTTPTERPTRVGDSPVVLGEHGAPLVLLFERCEGGGGVPAS